MKPNLEDILVSDLKFDPDNPRLPNRYKHSIDQEIVKYFLLECNLVELMMSIGEKGYFAGEPLMVVEDTDSKYFVVEGNRRLAALKLLTDEIEPPLQQGRVSLVKSGAKEKPDAVPCLVFSDRDEILVYLGYRHITGIKAWDALAKARYVKQLRSYHNIDDHEKAHKELAKEIGSKSTTVAKYLTGLELLTKAEDLGILSRLKLEADDIPFSLLTTGIGWEDIANFIGLEGASDVEANNIRPQELEEFFTWTFKKESGGHTVLGESRNFSKMARIVSSPEALKALRKGDPLDQADLLTSGPLETIRAQLVSADKALQLAQETLAIAQGLDEDDLAMAEKVQKKAKNLLVSIRSEFQNEDD